MIQGKDNRHHPRVEIFAQVQVTRDSDVYIMSTMNISRGGIFIQGNPPEYPDLKVGVMVEIVIFAADDIGSEDVMLMAKVVRIETESGIRKNPGFGLQFVTVNPTQSTLLTKLIRANQILWTKP